MINFIQDHLASLQGRITAGATFASAIAFSLIPTAGSRFDLVEFLGISGAGAVWLLAELADAKSPSEHDRILFKRYQESATPGLLNFLQEHEFHFSFARNQIERLNEISYLEGVRHEFVDVKINEKWMDLHNEVQEFLAVVAKNTIPVHGNPSVATVHPSGGDVDFPTTETQAEIAELNAKAKSLQDAMSKFERYARKSLKV